MFEDFNEHVQNNMQIALFDACRSIPRDDYSRRLKTAEFIIRAARQGITSAAGLKAVARRSLFRVIK